METKSKTKKKILIVTAFPTHGAGSGALITTQAKSYVENGDEVVIITGNNRTDFDKLDGVRYHVVPFTAETENPEKIEGQCPFNYLMFTTHTESTANFWNVSLEEIEAYNKAFEKAIREEVQNFNPDIIHAQHNWLTSSICNNFDKPVALTIHGTDLMGYIKAGEKLEAIQQQIAEKKETLTKSKDKKGLENLGIVEEIYRRSTTKAEIMRELKTAIKSKKLDITKPELEELINLFDSKTLYELYKREAEKSARQSGRIIVISDAQEEQFNNLFPGNESKVRLLENGYDAKVFYQDKKVKRDDIIPKLIGKENLDYDNMVLFVGKFADFKGIDALLDAAKIYEKHAEVEGKRIETIIVGSGVLDDKLREQAKELNLQHTHFVGRKNHGEICKLQNLADVSLIPSRNEPFGLVVIEGTSCGHPVIATNSGGIPGILNTEKEDLSDKSKSYVTKLGVLVAPLPDRPSELDDEAKERLDEMTTKYSMIEEDKKEKFTAEKAKELKISADALKAYFDEYMRTVRGLSSAVIDICDKKLEFNNDEIAKYTEETYSQEVIRDKILGIFDEAQEEFQKKNKGLQK